MAKTKNPISDQPTLPKSESSNGSEEIERRLVALEKSTSDLNNRIFDSHKWFVTVLFSAVAVLLGVYVVMSKLDVSNSTREMKQDVKDKLDDVEKRFHALAGEALKKPLLEIADTQGALDGQVFEIPPGGQIPFYPLFIKNVGDKKTDPIAIRLHTSSDLTGISQIDWQPVATNVKDYPFSYYCNLSINSRTAGIGIAPQETWTMQVISVARFFLR